MPETRAARQSGHATQMLRSYAQLLRSPTFCGYAVGGACTTTSFYAFTSESPFIFMDQLHRPAEEVGFYYLLLFSDILLGSFVANRMVRRTLPVLLLCGASLTAVLGAAISFGLSATGTLSVAGVVGSVILFTIGAGTASPLALTGWGMSVVPDAIAAAGLYGFMQMAFGALCTLIVSQWHGTRALGGLRAARLDRRRPGRGDGGDTARLRPAVALSLDQPGPHLGMNPTNKYRCLISWNNQSARGVSLPAVQHLFVFGRGRT